MADDAAVGHRGRLLRGLQHRGYCDEELLHASPEAAAEKVHSGAATDIVATIKCICSTCSESLPQTTWRCCLRFYGVGSVFFRTVPFENESCSVTYLDCC